MVVSGLHAASIFTVTLSGGENAARLYRQATMNVVMHIHRRGGETGYVMSPQPCTISQLQRSKYEVTFMKTRELRVIFILFRLRTGINATYIHNTTFRNTGTVRNFSGLMADYLVIFWFKLLRTISVNRPRVFRIEKYF
jgi:hypothetical protein